MITSCKWLNSSNWSLDETLTDTTTPCRVEQGVMAMKRYSELPKASPLDVSMSYSGPLLRDRGNLLPL